MAQARIIPDDVSAMSNLEMACGIIYGIIVTLHFLNCQDTVAVVLLNVVLRCFLDSSKTAFT